jgi:hypothetical protein
MADSIHMSYPVVTFENIKQNSTEVLKQFREWGVLVITNVFTKPECQKHCESLIHSLETISPPLSSSDLKTWKPENLPSGPRSGLFQTLVSCFPAVLEIRTDDRIREIFEIVYSNLRETPVKDFFTSMDGINVKPPIPPFQNDSESKDWAHLDQTIRGEPFRCVQGQVVLSDTSAGFRASPKSHLVYDDLLEEHMPERQDLLNLGTVPEGSCTLSRVPQNDTSNWWKVPHPYDTFKAQVEKVGGQWQVPIEAPAGSFVAWFSSTVHSARYQTKTEMPKVPKALLDNWRFVVYVCYRPKSDVPQKKRKRHEERLRRCFEEGRVTNHWGTRMFPKRSCFGEKPKNEHLSDILQNPQKIRKIFTPNQEVATKLQKLM